MNDFTRCNKVSGVYWLNVSMEYLKIKVILKPPDDILSLPKFEDYTNETDSINIESNIQEYSFKWQEKSFSSWEVHRYSEIHNCLTDAEIKYHEMIKSQEINPNKVFTYIHEDQHMPLPFSKKRNGLQFEQISKLERCMEYLNLDDVVGSIGRVFGEKTDSMSHLLKSRSSLCEAEKWIAMHVVFDHGDQNEAILMKQESTLLSIYHNITQNYVILSPDNNNLEYNPYSVEGSIPVDFKYEVNVDFGKLERGEELETLLTRLNNKWEKKHRALVDFVMPSLGTIQYYVTIDVIYAEGFDMDNLYIEYTIKLPEGIQCNDALHGRTHTSASTSNDDDDVWNFGHLIELCMETDLIEKPPLKLYLEVISTDWHRNHRTEGYVYHPLVLTPGLRTQELTCLRPGEKTWRREDRRFFVGGCHLIQDLEVLSKADGENTNFINTTSGKVHIRYSIISHGSYTPGVCGTAGVCGTSGVSGTSGYKVQGSALLEGAEAALDKYRRARARLAAATKDIKIGCGDA